jgi:hypothetical protein
MAPAFRITRRLLPALLLAPAAHRTRPERRAEALAAFEAACAAVARGAARQAGAVCRGPLRPGPGGAGGHGAARDPSFDALFGAGLAAFPGAQAWAASSARPRGVATTCMPSGPRGSSET